MAIFQWAWAVPGAGILIGCIMGFVARSHHFCTMAALERHWYAGDDTGLRSWVLAAATALAGTMILQFTGIVDLSQSFYLTEPVPIAGAIVGGLMFGVGMALVGTCGFGAIVRFGGGNLRALVVLTGMGLAAIAAQRGITGHAREWFINPLSLDLTRFGSSAAGTPFTISGALDGAFLIGAAIVSGLVIWCFGDAQFRADKGKMIAGFLIGLCIVAGWFVTGMAASVGFEPFEVEAGSFVAPVGDTILQIITVTGQLPDYGVGLMVGVFLGAAFAAWRSDDMRWEACDDARELGRHLAGAFLMGTGGVLALGCTIGQGISAVSMLAVSTPLAIASIAIGARIGLSFLLEGRPFAFLADGQPERSQQPAE